MTIVNESVATKQPGDKLDNMVDYLPKTYLDKREEIGNPVFKNRFEQAFRFVLPYLKENVPLSELNCLEVGCGEGAKACALSPYFASYTAFDIDSESIRKARSRAQLLGVDQHIEFLTLEASRLGELIRSGKYDFIMLYAIVEHLTIEERLYTLKTLWSELPEHGYLYVGEAPNRISPIDYHSSRLPYFQNLPVELARQFYVKSHHKSWIDRVENEESLELGLYRNGQAVSFHDFEISIASSKDLRRHLVADNFDVRMLNMNPLRWFELNTLKDFEGHRCDSQLNEPYDIPAVFSRYWIDFLLSKSAQPKIESLPDPVHVQMGATEDMPFAHDIMRNRILLLDNKHSCVTMNIPRSTTELLISISSVTECEDALLYISCEKQVIWQSTIANLKKPSLDYWNPLSWTSVSLEAPLHSCEIEIGIDSTVNGIVGLGPALAR